MEGLLTQDKMDAMMTNMNDNGYNDPIEDQD